MGLFNWLPDVGGIIDAGNNVVRTISGDVAAKDRQDFGTRQATLAQFAAEFAHPNRGWFDALVDGLNRLPRPILAFSTIGLFVFAFVDPVSFAARMQALALVPPQMWIILGAIITFFFGSRLPKDFGRVGKYTTEQVAQVVNSIKDIRGLAPRRPDPVDIGEDHNPALDDFYAEGRT